MNKLFLFTVLSMVANVNLQASDQKNNDKNEGLAFMYESSSRNPMQIIKTDLKTGLQELIPVLIGENREAKTEELMMLEVIAYLKSKQSSDDRKNKQN